MAQASGLSNNILKDVSFNIKRGEIVGFYGLVGAGKTEIARALFGADKASGTITFKGQKVGNSPKKAIAAGITLVPEERRTQGLFTSLSIRENIPVMNLDRLSNYGVYRSTVERDAAVEYVEKLSIATDSIDKNTEKLSGGNQQRVVLARELSQNPKVLVAAQPTRGLDVGAIEYMSDRLTAAANDGVAVLLISSELEEILDLSHRIVVMHAGRIVGEMNRSDVDLEQLGLLMGGVTA